MKFRDSADLFSHVHPRVVSRVFRCPLVPPPTGLQRAEKPSTTHHLGVPLAACLRYGNADLWYLSPLVQRAYVTRPTRVGERESNVLFNSFTSSRTGTMKEILGIARIRA